MSNYDILKSYYKEVCAPLIFVGERIEGTENNIKVYLYDFSKKIEMENFKKVFQEYMFMYAKNYDIIEHLDLTKGVSSVLSKKYKNTFIEDTPRRETATNGIFGELFNDFYLRNILNENSMLAYASRRAYNNNSEAKGIDIVFCNDQLESLEIVLSEAKFVGNITYAKNSLISDISGTENHLNKGYIDSYMDFVLDRQGGLEKSRKESIISKIKAINGKRIAEEMGFIDIVNELNYSIKFVYFAIFQYENNRSIDKFRAVAEEIINEFYIKIKDTSIRNYSVDIVFIPTFNTSMVLKHKMEETDE